jgi:hypothetical protein
MTIASSPPLIVCRLGREGVFGSVSMALSFLANVGAGGSGTWFANRIVIPLFLRWLLPIIEDKDRMEAALRASSVEWVSVRLPNIVEGPERPLRMSADGRGIGLSITAASTARFLLDRATGSELLCATPSISN